MSKGVYYAGMATAPQVQLADFAAPLANMVARLDEANKRYLEAILGEQKANAKFIQSEQDKLRDVVTSTDYKNFGLDNLDLAANEFANHLMDNFEVANFEFNQNKNKARLTEVNTNLLSSARNVEALNKRATSFIDNKTRLEANGKSSAWNDLVTSFLNDANRKIRFETSGRGETSLVTLGEDNVQRKIPSGSMQDFFTARPATDMPGLLQDILKNSEPYATESKTTTYKRYLDYSKNPDGELTFAQADILTKQLNNLDARDVYDAAVRAGIVGDAEGQISIVTDFSNENIITPQNLTDMRTRLGLQLSEDLRQLYKNNESRAPRHDKVSGTGKVYSIYDNETGKYSYRNNSQTSFTLKNGFQGIDMINGQPSGKAKDIPPSSWITDIRLTPAGVEVWGVQIKDRETGEIQWSNTAPTSMSDEEVSQMGGNRINFHKVIPVNQGNQQAIGELQRVFGFKPEDLQAQLSLGLGINSEGSGETIPEVDLNDPSRYE